MDLCETVAEAAEIVSIMLSNLANKMVKIMKGEEVGRALPKRSIKQQRYDKQWKRGAESIRKSKRRNNSPLNLRPEWVEC